VRSYRDWSKNGTMGTSDATGDKKMIHGEVVAEDIAYVAAAWTGIYP
jgi:hypothetical protein